MEEEAAAESGNRSTSGSGEWQQEHKRQRRVATGAQAAAESGNRSTSGSGEWQ